MITSRTPEVLSDAECWQLTRQTQVGRLAVVFDGRPEIFPVNFVVDHGSVVMRMSAGTKLSAAVGRPVAFEVDGYDDERGDAWSVVVKGTARELTGLDEVLDAMELPLTTWHAAPKPNLVRIEPDQVSGRRFPRSGTSQARVVRRTAVE